jgi:glycosyltransferase involved in cell wall biosynthesis
VVIGSRCLNDALDSWGFFALPSHQSDSRLRVGSWPGRSYTGNTFITTFCDAVQQAGAEVVDVADPRALQKDVHILHVHWPEQVLWAGGPAPRMFARAAHTLRALARLKNRGTKIIWLIHNLRPHDLTFSQASVWRVYGPLFTRLVDGYMTLSPSTLELASAALPALQGKPKTFAWHPTYESSERNAAVRSATRARFGVSEDDRVLGYVGLLRPYKQLEDLIDASSGLEASHKIIIAGRPISDEYGLTLEARAKRSKNIVLQLGFLDDEQFAEVTSALDVVVAPMRSYLHSGSLVYALSASRPIVTPDTPFARDLRSQAGSRWVQLYDPPLTAPKLAHFGRWAEAKGRPDLSALAPDCLGSRVLTFYRTFMPLV